MLALNENAVHQNAKCFVTYGLMGHLDPNQPPSKTQPWVTLAGQDFVHKADLIIPHDVLGVVRGRLIEGRSGPEFKRVVLSLREILSGDFFTEYIKKGNVLMLSEGRRGIDNVYTLRQGILTMFLDKETYERAGLVGKPDGVKGKRGTKPRWIVEIDLTVPSMIPGKKGFDRLVYASKNALAEPITWLFCNLSATTPDPDPLSQHSPVSCACNPSISEAIDVMMPNLAPDVDFLSSDGRGDFEDFSTSIYEWLSLVRLQSPRVEVGDQIDPYLSRYQVPEGGARSTVCKISWKGFLAPSWSRQTLMDLVTALPPKAWFSFSITTFSKGLTGDNTECTILRPPNSSGEYLMWEVKAHE